VAAPAGLIIWILGNVSVEGAPLLTYCAGFLQPLGTAMGLDGMILLAFLLGFPANEIVLPILLMGYLRCGVLTDYESLEQLRQLLVDNGWSVCTAVCAMVFCLCHLPCGTTCLTIYRETKSIKWTAVGMLLPTFCGVVLCVILHSVFALF
jgi:ferrous iron transport protein B